MIFDKDDFKAYDSDLWNAIAKEEERQQNNIELIASENVVSQAVMAAQGSILTNKYAEGYPGRRYYGGTDVVYYRNSSYRTCEGDFWSKVC